MALAPVDNSYAATASSLEQQKSAVEQDKNKASQELEAVKDKIDAKDAEISKSEENVKSYQVKIDELQGQINSIKGSLKSIQKEIDNKKKDIQVKEKEKEEKEKVLASRLRSMYKSNYEGEMLMVLIESNNISDFISKLVAITKIVQTDKNMIEEVNKVKAALDSEKAEMEERQSFLIDQKNEIVTKQEEVKSTQKIYIDENNKLQAEKKSLQELKDQKQKMFNDLAEKESQIQKQLDDLITSLNSDNNVSNNVASSQGFVWPASGPVTCPFGPRIHPVTGKPSYHTGIDIGASYGSPIKAAKSGKVVAAQSNSIYGNMVVINHGNGQQTMYAHSSRYIVTVGQEVTQGQVIAYVGSTGLSSGPHLHFEIRINGTAVNPMNYLN